MRFARRAARVEPLEPSDQVEEELLTEIVARMTRQAQAADQPTRSRIGLMQQNIKIGSGNRLEVEATIWLARGGDCIGVHVSVLPEQATHGRRGRTPSCHISFGLSKRLCFRNRALGELHKSHDL
jgi:hypothetical protein